MAEQPEIDRAAAVIGAGGIVAFPTETYYGLAVDPFNQAALSRLFAVKQRAAGKAILVLIDDVGGLDELVAAVPPHFIPLMRRWWPGPLTLVFEGRPGLPDLLTGGTGTIGIRISSNPLAQRLVKGVGRPITATSANLSGRGPAVNPREVAGQFGNRLDGVLDGGETPGGAGSTVVGRCGDGLVLLRPGVIPFEALLSG